MRAPRDTPNAAEEREFPAIGLRPGRTTGRIAFRTGKDVSRPRGTSRDARRCSIWSGQTEPAGAQSGLGDSRATDVSERSQRRQNGPPRPITDDLRRRRNPGRQHRADLALLAADAAIVRLRARDRRAAAAFRPRPEGHAERAP